MKYLATAAFFVILILVVFLLDKTIHRWRPTQDAIIYDDRSLTTTFVKFEWCSRHGEIREVGREIISSSGREGK